MFSATSYTSPIHIKDGDVKTEASGEISFTSPGNPSAIINVSITNGGKLHISDDNGDASITGRVDIHGTTSALKARDGEKSIQNLTTGALRLWDGASVAIEGTLTGQAATPYYVTIASGCDLSVGGGTFRSTCQE